MSPNESQNAEVRSQNPQAKFPQAKILILGDSPVSRPGQAITGFGRVVKNIFTQFIASGISPRQIEQWAINFDGWGYEKCPWRLFPAMGHWNSPARLSEFLEFLARGGYTHLWILMDADALSGTNFGEALQRVCAKRNIRTLLYYPVDAPLQAPCEIIQFVDEAVTFTEYGREETRKAILNGLFARSINWAFQPSEPSEDPAVKVIPHGLEPHFKILPAEVRQKYRDMIVSKQGDEPARKFLEPGDFLMVNVNKNEWRKDPLRSLEILAGLRAQGVPAKLVMRMNPTSLNGGVHLERCAEQLGLTLDKEWAHIGPFPEEHLPGLYAAADLVLTTTLGEGWGFSITEALGCGTPVALPWHTSCEEIGRKIQTSNIKTPNFEIVPLDLERGAVCGNDTRLRRRVHLQNAIASIHAFYAGCAETSAGEMAKPTYTMPPQIREWLSWPRVAGEFLKLMKIS